jgi:serine/threonine protein kinase
MTTLAEPLDAYGQWLEIPPHEQPADHYRLLGLARFETDAARITAAADERMARVRSFQLGPHAALSQRILNELSAARATLLDARRRVSYDLVLRSAGPASSEAWPPGAQPALPSGELAAGTVIDGYRIVEKATSTMLGVTYKAQDVESRRPVFLKTLSPKAARKQEVRKRFQREIEILTRLDHPNLIVARHSGEHRGLPYLVMDYVVGELHLRGVIHRNIKPHALLVDLRGNLRITNLLLAKIGDSSLILSEDEDLTTQGESMGSIDYLPPEQAIDASKADERSDIYALGCTLFYLVTAQPPYAMKSPVDKLLAHRQAAIPSLRRLRSEAPAWLDAACQKMLAKWPADRYQQVSDVIRDLTQPPEQRPLWSRLLNWLGWRKK